MAFRGSVASAEWIGGIDSSTGAVVPLAELAGDAVAVESRAFVGQALQFGLPLPGRDDSSVLTYGIGRPDTPRSFESGAPVFLGGLGLDNRPNEIDRFGGAVLRLVYEVSDTGRPEDAPITLTIDMTLQWRDTESGGVDGDAPDEIRILDASATSPEGVGFELIGFGSTLDPDAAVPGFTAAEFDDGSGMLLGRITVGSLPGGDNRAPVAEDDRATTPAGVPVRIDALANDTDPDGDDLALSILLPPVFGSAAVEGGAILYTPPDAEFAGEDVFSYAIDDGRGGSDETSVTVRVGPDFVLVGGPDARLLEDGAPGGRAFTWVEGEDIVLIQVVANAGADTDLLTELESPSLLLMPALVRRVPDEPAAGFFQFLVGSFATPPPLEIVDLGPGTSAGLTTLLTIDAAFLDAIPPGEYRLEVFLDPTDAIPEIDDATGHELAPGTAPTVLVSQETPVEIAAGILGGAFFGTGGNDLFVAQAPGGNTVDGGEGVDTMLLRVSREEIDATIRPVSPQGAAAPVPLALGPGEAVEIRDRETGRIDTLTGIERLQLEDGVLLFDLPGEGVPFTYRLYSAAFARTPDERGLRFWSDRREDGLADRGMAEAFIDSPEFAEKFGADPTDEAFIAALFGNVLLREPDPGGEAFWLGAFGSGALDRADMLLAFSESAENIARNAENTEDGIWIL